jgi:hypothetical protein
MIEEHAARMTGESNTFISLAGARFGVTASSRLRILKTAWIGLLLWVCTGCGSGPKALRAGLEAERGANANSAVAVAVLVVYDDSVFHELSKLSAAEWFQEAEQRKRDNPEGAAFDLLSWELMPGQRVKEEAVELQGRPAKGLVFADYHTPGRHRARFNPAKRILIVLGVDDFTVVDLDDN